MIQYKRFSDARRVFSIGLSLVVLAAHAVAAPITNGGFETGDFSNWGGRAFGAVVSAAFPLAPIAGNYSALLISRGSQSAGGPGNPTAGCASDPWMLDPLCPPPPFPGPVNFGSEFGHPNFAPSEYGFNYIHQTFDASAGDRLSVSWRGMSNEGVPVEQVITRLTNGVDYIDSVIFARGSYVVTGKYGLQAVVVNTGDPGLVSIAAPVGTGFLLATETFTGTTNVPTTGIWTLYIGVGQLYDSYISSGIVIDNVWQQPQAVPEPNSLLLMSVGAAGLLCVGLRKKLPA